jgi:hypothetical protein
MPVRKAIRCYARSNLSEDKQSNALSERKAIRCYARSNLNEDKQSNALSERKTSNYVASAGVKKSEALFRAQDEQLRCEFRS